MFTISDNRCSRSQEYSPTFTGHANVAKSNMLAMDIYLYRGARKNRKKKTILGKKCCSSNSKKYAKSAKEPWVIVTSLPHRHNTAKKVIKLYRMRMQIEQSFRDLKDKRYGFRFPESKTKNRLRLENLLIIALLATFAIWLAGQAAIEKKWHYQIQANTVRNKNVLSIAFIGIYVLRKLDKFKISMDDLTLALNSINKLVLEENSL